MTTAEGHAGVAGVSDQGTGNGLYGRSAAANGVLGLSSADGGSGVAGLNEDGTGNGVYGLSARTDGVLGVTKSDGHAGVAGVSDSGVSNGVYGRSAKANGLIGYSSADAGAGVAGVNEDGGGNGVYGLSARNDGVLGVSRANGKAGTAGVNDSAGGVGVYGKGAHRAAVFIGDVDVTGELYMVGADYAEEFPAAADLAGPGDCVVLDDSGAVQPCALDYDVRVAGVISGAGGVRPAIVLDRADGHRVPVAMMGKAYVWVDADRGSVRPGDLLTTSSMRGHAMRALDRERSFGAVIGKALTSLERGTGLVRVLVMNR